MSALSNVLGEIGHYLPGFPRPSPRFVTDDGRRVHGIVAEWSETPAAVHAAEMVRDAGYKRWDLNSPFPIHGIEEAMGFAKTKLPYLVFGAAMTGVAGGALMQWFMNDWDYDFIVQGKPTGAYEPFVPVMFELGVLASAFAALIGMLAMNGLPRWNHPVFTHERFLGTSDDRFIIAIEADDPAFDPDATRALLERAGGKNIDLIIEDA